MAIHLTMALAALRLALVAAAVALLAAALPAPFRITASGEPAGRRGR